MKRRNVMVIIALMVIGFASVTTTLIINGTLNVGFNNQDFDVYFSNAIVNGKENKSVIKEARKIEFDVDMSLKGEKYELEYFITNGSRNYDAELNINCQGIDEEYLSLDNDFVNGTVLASTETTDGNKLTVTVEKVYAGEEEDTKNFEITCEIVATPKEKEDNNSKPPVEEKCTIENPTVLTYNAWKLTDNDCSGDLSIDDLITIDTESFYVYDIEGENVKALAQYNLLLGNSYDGENVIPLENPTGLQSPEAKGYVSGDQYIGTVAYNLNYPEGTNIYETSTIKEYVEAYATKLSKMDTNINTVRLITKEELDKFGCDSEKFTCKSASSYVYSTTYWTSSPRAENVYDVWRVVSDGDYDWQYVINDVIDGVRPVIEISKSLFK